jgi:arabinogalactan endo-1,4-beta-galactosidase
MKPSIIIALLCSFTLFSTACKKDRPDDPDPVAKTLLKGADLSFLPEIESYNIPFSNRNGQPEDVLTTLKNNGCNVVRLRLWKTPAGAFDKFEQVKAFAQRIKANNLKLWISVHYSDTWADPGNQTMPAGWENLTFAQLSDSVYTYTKTIATQLQPDYIQIGNEINSGLLWPSGHIVNEVQFKSLLGSGIQAVREAAPNAKIMIHFAGIDGAEWFYDKVAGLDYDIIALSFYPIWHGKNLSQLSNALSQLSLTHNKDVIIAETAYPFTLGWNDWTNNIVGLQDQLIPAYPATPEGQKNFLAAVKNVAKNLERGLGFCYWGGEWVAFKGDQATDCSPWENQALYDFNFKALPAVEVFNEE